MRRRNKKALSAMLAYALLIVIAIALAVIVYAWFKGIIPGFNKDECPEGMSIVIQEYQCSGGVLELTIKNKGLFSFDGYYIKGTNDADQIADFKLPVVSGGEDGIYNFSVPLGPDESNATSFDYSTLSELRKIEVEPFRIQEKKEGVKKDITVLCQKAFLFQELQGCDMTVSGCGDLICGGGEDCSTCPGDCVCPGTTPYCDTGVCVECLDDVDCGPGRACSGGVCIIPGPGCPDGSCDAGESCPADATDPLCLDTECYEPTCISGCGQEPVVARENDETCLDPNMCDGAGNCVECVDTSDCPVGNCIGGLCLMMPTDYVSWWKFDMIIDGPPITTPDEAGASPGTLLFGSNIAYDAQREYDPVTNGYVLSLDGVDDYVNLGSSDFGLTNEVSVSVWVKETSRPDFYRTIIMKSTYSRPFMIQLSGGYPSDVRTMIRGPSGEEYFFANDLISQNQWYHLALVYGDGYHKVYVDGIEQVSTARSGNLEIVAGDGVVGKANPEDIAYFKGYIDDLMIYNRALSDNEIYNIYISQS